MTPAEEAAIRKRDAEYDNPDSLVGECPLQAMDDRRALLRALDELRALAEDHSPASARGEAVSDYSELVARLRKVRHDLETCRPIWQDQYEFLTEQAADALEAQGRRIRELEVANENLCRQHADTVNLAREREQAQGRRLAALEAEHAVVCKEVHEGEVNECRLEARLAEAEAHAANDRLVVEEAQRRLVEAEALLQCCDSTLTDLLDTLDHDEDCPWWDEVRDTPEAVAWPACGCWKRGAQIMRDNIRELLPGQRNAFLAPPPEVKP